MDHVAERIEPQAGRAAARTAPWSARVVALIIDSVLISVAVGITTGQWPQGLWISMPGDGAPSALEGSATWVYLGLSLAMLAAQAYTGYTAGKALIGIRLVDGDTHRPVGLVRVIVREFVHILDGLLMIGYLRPLWHPQRRTFADSIMHTLVLDEPARRRSR